MKPKPDHRLARALRRHQLARIKHQRIREREAREARLGVPPGKAAGRERRAGLLANTLVVTPVIRDRGPAWEAGLTQGERGLSALAGTVKDGRADFALIGTQGPVCLFYDEPRRGTASGVMHPGPARVTNCNPAWRAGGPGWMKK